MSNCYGVAQGDEIINIIVAETLEDAEVATGYNAEIVDVPGIAISWVRTADGWSAPDAPTRPRDLTALDFELHVQSAAGLSDDDVIAMLDDPALRLFWRRLNQANLIAADHPLVADGLNKLAELEHLTEAQRQAVLENWPVA